MRALAPVARYSDWSDITANAVPGVTLDRVAETNSLETDCMFNYFNFELEPVPSKATPDYRETPKRANCGQRILRSAFGNVQDSERASNKLLITDRGTRQAIIHSLGRVSESGLPRASWRISCCEQLRSEGPVEMKRSSTTAPRDARRSGADESSIKVCQMGRQGRFKP